MDMEKMALRLMNGENGAALKALTESEAGARLAARFDGRSVEQALREGDDETLRGVLQSVLGTPEGRRFAEQVREAMDGHGR